jgi:hypothetical protein
MRRLHCMAVSAALLVLTIAASAGAFTLATNGKPACSIVIAEKAGPNAKIGAQELQKYVEKISGAKLEIHTDAENVAGPKVLIGRSKLTSAIAGLTIPNGMTLKMKEEGYVIHCAGDTLVLAGNDSAPADCKEAAAEVRNTKRAQDPIYLGTRYAVYDFIQRLGVRWFTPGDYGEVVPKSSTIQFADVSITKKPDFPLRSAWCFGDDWTLWAIRHGQNPEGVGWFGVPGDSSLNGYVPKDKIKEHPEWFALQPDGSRSLMPCMSDELRRNDPKYAGQPRLLDAMTDRIGQDVEVGSQNSAFSPDDGTPYCMCDLCGKTSYRFYDDWAVAFRPGAEGDPAGDPIPSYLTGQEWFFFVNGILDNSAKNWPSHFIATNGYANRYFPPEFGPEFNQHGNLVIMFADINSCTIHRFDDPKCWEMQRQLQILKRWCKLCDKTWIYGYNYTMLVGKGTLTPQEKRIAADVPMVKEAGSIGFADQEWRDISQLGIPTYLTRFAMEWDTKTDVRALLNDFYSKWFGPAGPAMRDYYETLENAFDGAVAHGHEDVVLPMVYTPAVMSQLAVDMAKAQAAASTDAEKTHVKMESMMFQHLDLYVRSLQAKQELRFADAASMLRQMQALKLKMREIDQNFGWPPSPYAMDWEAARMDRYVARIDGKEGKMLAPLPMTAKFCTDKRDVGRFARWEDTDYNDSKWQSCKTDIGWQMQGLRDEDGLPLMTKDGHPYRGVGWYRFTVDVPTFQAGKSVKLMCPGMNNQGWVWVNGTYCGRNEFKQAWFRPSELEVDVTKYLKPGKNVIAVRILSNEEYFGSNGIYENPFLWISR